MLIERYESHGLKIRIYDDCFYIELTKYARFWDVEKYGELSSDEKRKDWDKLKTIEGVKELIEEILSTANCDPALWRDPYGIYDRPDGFIPEN